MNAGSKLRLSTRLPRWLFLTASLSLLAYALHWERHEVLRFDDGPAQHLTGPAFVEGTTYDGFGLRLGRLYDAYSLSPLAASLRDCKT
jgi:hypothetical protein